jgi:hypothetical protein
MYITTYDCRLQTRMAVLTGSRGRGSGVHRFLNTASLKKTKELSSPLPSPVGDDGGATVEGLSEPK